MKLTTVGNKKEDDKEKEKKVQKSKDAEKGIFFNSICGDRTTL